MGCVIMQTTNLYAWLICVHIVRLKVDTYMHKFHCLSADPEDYSSAVCYNVSFSQTALLDIFEPRPIAQSSPFVIDIMSDDTFEGIEYFQARIVETPDFERVRIGQDTVNVTIIDSETLILSDKFSFSTK